MTTDSESTDSIKRSGGADLDAQGDIHVGGDVVGRDKIVHIHVEPEQTRVTGRQQFSTERRAVYRTVGHAGRSAREGSDRLVG